jgi:hypothetical protein
LAPLAKELVHLPGKPAGVCEPSDIEKAQLQNSRFGLKCNTNDVVWREATREA